MDMKRKKFILSAAMELCYPMDAIKKLSVAKTEAEMERILISARRKEKTR